MVTDIKSGQQKLTVDTGADTAAGAVGESRDADLVDIFAAQVSATFASV